LKNSQRRDELAEHLLKVQGRTCTSTLEVHLTFAV